MKLAVGEFLRHGLARAKIDHVEGTDRYNLGNARLGSRSQSIWPGGKDAADELVRELRRRNIQHASKNSFANERLHRLPAVARGMKDNDFVAGVFKDFSC